MKVDVLFVCRLIDWWTELRFCVSLDTKEVILKSLHVQTAVLVNKYKLRHNTDIFWSLSTWNCPCLLLGRRPMIASDASMSPLTAPLSTTLMWGRRRKAVWRQTVWWRHRRRVTSPVTSRRRGMVCRWQLVEWSHLCHFQDLEWCGRQWQVLDRLMRQQVIRRRRHDYRTDSTQWVYW